MSCTCRRETTEVVGGGALQENKKDAVKVHNQADSRIRVSDYATSAVIETHSQGLFAAEQPAALITGIHFPLQNQLGYEG